MVRSAMLLARAFPKLRGRAMRLAGQINQLAAVIDGIQMERDDLRAETRRLTDAQTRLSQLMQAKRQSLKLRRLELAETERTARQIGDRVTNLEELLASLESDPSVEILPLSEELYERAFELYRNRPDKEWGITDCISFIVMQDRGLTEALTTDEHFEQAGFKALMR